MLVEWDEADDSKDKWLIIETLAMFLNHEDVVSWASMRSNDPASYTLTDRYLVLEDGPRAMLTLNLIGCAVLTTLEQFEREGLFKPDSPIKDLALIMSEYLDIADGFNGSGFDSDGWDDHVVGYAKKHNIELGFTADRVKRVERRDGEPESLQEALDENEDDDPWAWKARVSSENYNTGE